MYSERYFGTASALSKYSQEMKPEVCEGQTFHLFMGEDLSVKIRRGFAVTTNSGHVLRRFPIIRRATDFLLDLSLL